MAERGRETLRHGPMKPVGLTNPHAPDVKPHAVVQLRRDNALGTLYNIVGFQTKMKYGAQTEVFRMIPGLENASSRASAASTATPSSTRRRCSTSRCGCGRAPTSASPARSPGSRAMSNPPRWGCSPGGWPRPRSWAGPAAAAAETAMGALLHHITGGAEAKTFQPMNVNFGLFPPIDAKGGRRGRRDRYRAYTDRAKAAFLGWLEWRDAA
jgi:methylenetetrahydrofolate--tRNA-(uracil-5-)-methyltransferase